jgi:probable F420-dependent oxidoreductase
MRLGRVGIWSRELRNGDPAEVADSAAELDELGYGAIWMPGGNGRTFFDVVHGQLAATSRIVVASGILNVWTNPPAQVTADHAAVTAAYPDRFLLGLGVSHAHIVEKLTDRRYERPLEVMRTYLDELDAGRPTVPASERVVAALGPGMLRISAKRSLGAHPYFVNTEHTRQARAILGPSVLLAPEQAVVLDEDADRAREVARGHLAVYLQLPNYANNLLRCGFGPEDLADGGSERLLEAVVARGGVEAAVGRIREHLEAGADHVCVQVLSATEGTLPRREWQVLAGALRAEQLL